MAKKKLDGKKIAFAIIKGTARGSLALGKKTYQANSRRRQRHQQYVSDNPVYMARHTITAKSVDWFTELAWQFFDKRDVKAGKITEAEWDAYMANPAGIEQWRRDTVKRRSENRARQRDSRVPGQWTPVTQSVTLAPALWTPDPVPATTTTQTFTPPKPRKNRPAATTGPAYRAPKKRTKPAKKIDRTTQLRGVWGDHWKNQKEIAMADVNVQAAIACLQALADEQPQDRAQFHAQLAAFAAVGEAVGAAAEKIRSTLEAPQRDGTPGVPSEVTTHMSPIPEAGQTIAQACQDTAHAFEDRFELAIKAAQDEDKMSDKFLKAQPA